MSIPDSLKYGSDHEWLRQEGDIATVGITDYAQGELGDIVFVELPQVGAELKAHDSCGVLEAVKTVSDVFAPVSGCVTEVNGKLADAPEIINSDPYGEGWIVKIQMSDPAECDALLSADQYREHIR